jgi:hypothetical protein
MIKTPETTHWISFASRGRPERINNYERFNVTRRTGGVLAIAAIFVSVTDYSNTVPLSKDDAIDDAVLPSSRYNLARLGVDI